MAYDFNQLKKQAKEVEEWLRRECQGIRTGRATPYLLDGVMVSAYGSHVPLKQVAAITVEDARSIRLNPWDKSQVKDIESALTAANLGVSVVADESGLRIIFPELTAEVRQKLTKVVKAKLEEARVSLRQARDKVWSEIQVGEREGKISEDAKFRLKDELQKLIDQTNEELDIVAAKKETEILN
ncbi:MAG: ribosome recycling factor [Patescibacteria group bacterium]